MALSEKQLADWQRAKVSFKGEVVGRVRDFEVRHTGKPDAVDVELDRLMGEEIDRAEIRRLRERGYLDGPPQFDDPGDPMKMLVQIARILANTETRPSSLELLIKAKDNRAIRVTSHHIKRLQALGCQVRVMSAGEGYKNVSIQFP